MTYWRRIRLIRNIRNTLTLGLAASIAPEQEFNTHKQATVGFYASGGPKLGKTARVYCLDPLFARPPPLTEPKGARSP